MINLPPQLTPSELLCCEKLPPSIDELLRGSRSLRGEGRLPEAERCALDGMQASQETGANVSQAVVLIHLADVHRDMGKLGPALADCQKAYRFFQRQPSHYQRHNEAVTAYALGLAHQLLGSEMDALKWYHASGELFERVKDDWTAVNALAQVETCTRVQRWMETLSEYLIAVRARPDANLATRIWVPIILSEGEEPGFAIAELGIDEYKLERQLTVNGESFDAYRLEGTRLVSLEPGVEYHAQEIPDQARESLGAGKGDYALVKRERNPNQEGPGVLDTSGGPIFGNFKRDDKGNVTLFTRFADNAVIVIGDKKIGDKEIVGYVAGLLKPT